MNRARLHIVEYDGPLARRADPKSSHLAGLKVSASGRVNSQRNMLFSWYSDWLIEQNGGMMTANEIAYHSGLKHPMIHKRLPELEKEGLLVKAEMRACQVTGQQAVTWDLNWLSVLSRIEDNLEGSAQS